MSVRNWFIDLAFFINLLLHDFSNFNDAGFSISTVLKSADFYPKMPEKESQLKIIHNKFS